MKFMISPDAKLRHSADTAANRTLRLRSPASLRETRQSRHPGALATGFGLSYFWMMTALTQTTTRTTTTRADRRGEAR